MLTEKDYCDYETCVALKELGYKVPTSAYYMPENSQLIFVINQFRGGAAVDCFYSNNSLSKECMASDFIDAPTMYEAQKWLREEKKMEVNATYDNIIELHWHWYMKSLTNRNQDTSIINYDSYEQALLAGIKEAIKILKEKSND